MPRKNTRNAQGTGTIRQRPDGRWEARITVGRDPGTGKQIQKSVYGATQQEVRKKLQATAVAIDEGDYTEPVKLTLGKWLDIWLETYVMNSVKPFTLKSYEVQCHNHIKPALGALKLSAVSPHAIQTFYNKLQRGSDTKAPLSPKTIKNIHGVLHMAFKQAVTLQYIKINPTDACTVPRVVRKEIKPMQEDDIAKFLVAIKGNKFETLFMVDLFTGMRQGEILGLTWDCIDFDSGTLLVNKQLQREKKIGGKYILAPNKNDKSRLITLATSVVTALKDHKEKQEKMKLSAEELWKESNFVFTDELGDCLKHVTVYKHFKKVVKEIGLPETRFHDMRHSYAVVALQSGDNIKTVQENLGHHTAAFTLDVYGHASQRMKNDSADRMEKFINSVSNG